MPLDPDRPEPRRRRGRRDNGLDAAAFVEVRDVDPRVGEDLLDLLRLAGVAAFLEPKVEMDPYLRATSLPSPPVDRLYIDRDAQETARGVLEHPDMTSAAAAHLHAAAGSVAGDAGPDERARSRRIELDSAAVDALFADLVADFDRSDVPDRPDRARAGRLVPPEVEQPPEVPADAEETDDDTLDEADGETDDEADDDEDRTPSSAADDGPQIWRGPSGSLGPAADDPAEHYHPPDPPPWRWPSKQAQLGILVLLAGAVALFVPDLVGLSGEVAVFLGVIGISGGVALLVLRLRKGDPDEDDDGAVV